MVAEIPQPNLTRQVLAEQLAGGLGDQDLPTMARRTDTRRPVHVQTGVVATDQDRLPRVGPHPYAQDRAIRPRVLGERPLPGHSRRDGLTGLGERDEKRIALRTNLPPVELRESSSKQLTVLIQHVDISVTQPLKQPRG